MPTEEIQTTRPGPFGRLYRWLDSRTGINSLLHEALDEPIPGGARLAYIFGSGLLFLLLSQVITGVALAVYYVPSADHAYTTVEYISKVVTGGSFLRSLHSYGSSAMVIVLLLHIGQVFIFGSYKGRRELLWLSGCLLSFLILGMAFTGYLLPWDQNAYFATTVGTNLLGYVPVIGDGLKDLLRGGTQMGTLTVSRFYVLHVFLLPAAIFAFIAAHVFLFRKAGAAGPMGEDPIQPTQKSEYFFPRQVMMDLGFTLLIIFALGVLAHFSPVPLGPKADPTDTLYLPRPEWFYRPMFQELKYFSGALEIVGILVIPSIIVTLFLLTPFLDRGNERRPWKRPIATSLFAILILGAVGLGALSYWDDMRDPNVAEQLAKQHEAMERQAAAPFEPEVVGGGPVAAAAITDPLIAQGETIFSTQACSACHGEGGTGTAIAPSLLGIGDKLPADQLAALLKNPTDQMKAGGMNPINLTVSDLSALTAYLETLK